MLGYKHESAKICEMYVTQQRKQHSGSIRWGILFVRAQAFVNDIKFLRNMYIYICSCVL